MFDYPKEFDDPQVSDGLINESIDYNDPKGISIGSMDIDNPKVYGDTSISDGLVFSSQCSRTAVVSVLIQ